MSQSTNSETTVAYRAEELIIGLSDFRLVAAELDKLTVQYRLMDTDQTLGLARVELSDVDLAADSLVRATKKLPRAAARGAADRPPEAALDRVLWGLRRLFSTRHGGWTPTLGKNRLMGRVHGVGEIMHGSDGDPSPTGDWVRPKQRPFGPGSGVRVGVLDTGFYPHPWLAGGWSARYSDLIAADGAEFADGHATFVTGLILSQAPGSTVEVRGALRQPGGVADTWTVAIQAVQFARSGLDVLNLSLACYTEDGQPPLVISRAVERLSADLVIVVAAGNHGARDDALPHRVLWRDLPAFPAALDGVIAVGATTADGAVASFSPQQPWVDIQARGVDVCSTFLNTIRTGSGPDDHDGGTPVLSDFEGWACWSGTSFAAALVTGAIAAGIEPGRISGQQALDDLLTSLGSGESSSGSGSATPTLRVSTPVW